MMNSYLNVCVVTKLTTRLNYFGFVIDANLQQVVMVLLLILMTTETQGLRVWRRVKECFNKATCNEIKSISLQK